MPDEAVAVPIAWGNGDYLYDDDPRRRDRGVTVLAAWERVGHGP